jgi:hypothetical protein
VASVLEYDEFPLAERVAETHRRGDEQDRRSPTSSPGEVFPQCAGDGRIRGYPARDNAR